MSEWPKCGNHRCGFYSTQWENHCNEYDDDDIIATICPAYKAPRPQDSSGSAEFTGYEPSLAECRGVVIDLVEAINDNDRLIGRTSVVLMQAKKRANTFLAK